MPPNHLSLRLISGWLRTTKIHKVAYDFYRDFNLTDIINSDKTRGMWSIFFGLIALFILPIWIFKYPALGDYPFHLFTVQIMKEYLNPVFEFNKCFVVYHSSYHSLSGYIILMLSKLFPIHVAGKIFLSIYIILMPLSVIYFLGSNSESHSHLRFRNGKPLIAIFSFLLIYNSFFHKGNIGFAISIPLTLFALGYILRHKSIGLKSFIIESLLLLLVYFAHPYSLFVALLFILLEKEHRKFSVSFLPSIIVLVINILTLPCGSEISIKWLNPQLKFRELGIYFFSFSYFKEALAIIPMYILYLYLFIRGPRQYKHIFFISLLAFFILPDHFIGDHVAQRILPFVILFGMLSLKQIGAKRKSPAFCGTSAEGNGRLGGTKYSFIAVPFLLLQLWVTIGNWSYVNKVYDKYCKVLNTIPAKSKIEVISAREDLYLGQISIFAHFQFYHHIAKGGISEPDFFTMPPVIYTGKCWDERWAIEFKKLKEDYIITARRLKKF